MLILCVHVYNINTRICVYMYTHDRIAYMYKYDKIYTCSIMETLQRTRLCCNQSIIWKSLMIRCYEPDHWSCSLFMVLNNFKDTSPQEQEVMISILVQPGVQALQQFIISKQKVIQTINIVFTFSNKYYKNLWRCNVTKVQQYKHNSFKGKPNPSDIISKKYIIITCISHDKILVPIIISGNILLY